MEAVLDEYEKKNSIEYAFQCDVFFSVATKPYELSRTAKETAADVYEMDEGEVDEYYEEGEGAEDVNVGFREPIDASFPTFIWTTFFVQWLIFE